MSFLNLRLSSLFASMVLLLGGALGYAKASAFQGETPSSFGVVSDAEIQAILKERIDNSHRGVGIVVGVIEPRGRRIISYGALNQGDPRPLNGQTLFEIGSITKVFTSLALADMVQRGEVSLDDPVAKFLPKEVKVPEWKGKSITLLDLATHTSGLPRLPNNLEPKDFSNPYADYSVERLFQFLSAYQLPRNIGAKYEYSNLGVGLLGQALSRRAGTDYERLVRTRIFDPLGMKWTAATLTADQKAHLAVGHKPSLEPTANWDNPTLAGCGGLRSNADDLLVFLAAIMGYTPTELAPAMAAMPIPRRPTGERGVEVALGWHIFSRKDSEIISHEGATGGYGAFCGFNPKTRVGVVVLSNVYSLEGVGDIGRHLLDPRQPLIPAAKPRTPIALDAAYLDLLVGRYRINSDLRVTVTREGECLYGQATGQEKMRLFAESNQDFFTREVEAEVHFEQDAKNKATGMVLLYGGQKMHAKRLEGEDPTHHELKCDPMLFDPYVGRYAYTPNFIMTISREGDHFFAQLSGQPRLEVFRESSRNFFYKVLDALLTFEADEKGHIAELILHQNGKHLVFKRLE